MVVDSEGMETNGKSVPQERRRLRATRFLLQSAPAPEFPALRPPGRPAARGRRLPNRERHRFLYASNFITRRRRTRTAPLAGAMLVENRAYDKQVEVRWRSETGDWQTIPAAVYVAPAGDNREPHGRRRSS